MKKITITVNIETEDFVKSEKQATKFVTDVSKAFNKHLNGYKGSIFDNNLEVNGTINIQTTE